MFSMTSTGYLTAVEYLKEINKLNEIEEELSTDGYSVVTLANYYWDKNNNDCS